MWPRAISACGVLLGGCIAWAPPVATTHGGAPGRLGPEQGEVRASGGWAYYPGLAAIGGSIPLAPEWKLELGSDTGFWDSFVFFATGRAGLRITPRPEGPIVGDVEAGGGAGFGGLASCGGTGSPSCPQPWEIGTGGAYLGTGMAVWVEPQHAFFMRTRMQLTTSTVAPATLWATAIFGGDFALGPARLDVAAGGWLGYSTAWSNPTGMFVVELGLSVPIGPANLRSTDYRPPAPAPRRRAVPLEPPLVRPPDPVEGGLGRALDLP